MHMYINTYKNKTNFGKGFKCKMHRPMQSIQSMQFTYEQPQYIMFCLQHETSSNRISEYVWFYNLCLYGQNVVSQQGWLKKTMGTIRQELGHSNVNTIL